MSARRGEVPFVAVRVGRSTDAKEVLGLAAELRISRPHALGILVLWEEMILSVGDALTGRIKGYSLAHLAAQLAWDGAPARLVKALANAGVLKCHRGTLVHPWWRESITGQYAITRAEFREADAERKRRARALERGEDSAVSNGRPLDNDGRHADKDRNPDINQVKDVQGTPPPPPAKAGGDSGASRWEWLRENHPRPRNSRACIRYLEAVTEADWALIQWLTTLSAKGGAPSSLSKKRVLRLNTHQILSTEAFLEILPEWRETQRPKKNGGTPLIRAVDTEAEAAARKASGMAFLLAQLSDPAVTEAKKQAVKSRWIESHGGPGPWELEAPPTEPLSTSVGPPH